MIERKWKISREKKGVSQKGSGEGGKEGWERMSERERERERELISC